MVGGVAVNLLTLYIAAPENTRRRYSMNFDYKGQRIYQPHHDDTDVMHDLYEILKDSVDTLGGSAHYERLLETYEINRVEWETKRSAPLQLVKEA